MNAELYVLTQVKREIANYTRAIAWGKFTLMGAALTEADMAQLDGRQQPAVVQLTPLMLEPHLQGMTEKLRSGDKGKVREAIQQSITRILVGVDGIITLETKADGLLGVEGIHARLSREDDGGIIDETLCSSDGRRWKVASAL